MNTIAQKLAILAKDEDFINLVVEDIKKKADEDFTTHKNFFEIRSTDILLQLHDYLSIGESVSDSPYDDFVFGNVTNEEFIMLFSCVSDERIVGIKTLVEKTSNEEIYKYNGLEFSQIHGQGTFFTIRKI